MAVDTYQDIWLEVSNVRVTGTTFQVQLRAERESERPRWWSTPSAKDPGASAAQFKTVSEALEKKRPVLAQLVANAGKLKVASLTIQYAESPR